MQSAARMFAQFLKTPGANWTHCQWRTRCHRVFDHQLPSPGCRSWGRSVHLDALAAASLMFFLSRSFLLQHVCPMKRRSPQSPTAAGSQQAFCILRLRSIVLSFLCSLPSSVQMIYLKSPNFPSCTCHSGLSRDYPVAAEITVGTLSFNWFGSCCIACAVKSLETFGTGLKVRLYGLLNR